MKPFKLSDDVLRQLAEQAKLSHKIDDVESLLTLGYLYQRLLLIFQVDDTLSLFDVKESIDEIKQQIINIIKTIQL